MVYHSSLELIKISSNPNTSFSPKFISHLFYWPQSNMTTFYILDISILWEGGLVQVSVGHVTFILKVGNGGHREPEDLVCSLPAMLWRLIEQHKGGTTGLTWKGRSPHVHGLWELQSTDDQNDFQFISEGLISVDARVLLSLFLFHNQTHNHCLVINLSFSTM